MDLSPDARQKTQILISAVSRQKARRFDDHSQILRRFRFFSDFLSVYQDFLIQPQKTADAFKKHRLSAAVPADQAVDLSPLKVQGDIVQGFVFFKPFCHSFYFNDAIHIFLTPPL